MYDASQITAVKDADGRDDKYIVRPPGSTETIEFDNPDFNFRSLRGNAVLRWEYRPGSTLFLVWQQQRSDQEGIGNFRMGRDLDRMFDARADNVFLVKVSYWLPR